MEKVSIIVPVYNAEDTIERCIKSLINQTYKNLEIVLINDGSKDNSLKKLKKAQEKNPDIIKIYDQKNIGVGKTRNWGGLALSTGDYISFVDADDYVDCDFIQVLVDNISDNDIVICGYRRVDDNGNTIFTQKLKNCDWSKFKQVTAWAKLYKKSFLKNNNIKFNELKIAEDIVFSITAYLNTNKVRTIEYVGYNNVDNKKSVTNNLNLKKENDILSTLELLGNIVSNRVLSKREKKYFRDFYNKIFCAFLFDKAIVLSYGELKQYYFDGIKWLKDYYKNNDMKFRFSYIKGEVFKINIVIFWTLFFYKCHLSNIYLIIVHKLFYKNSN